MYMSRAGQRPMHPMLSIGARALWGPGLRLKRGPDLDSRKKNKEREKKK